MLKGDFLTRNNLGTPQHFTLKSDQNAEISHPGHILPWCFQDIS